MFALLVAVMPTSCLLLFFPLPILLVGNNLSHSVSVRHFAVRLILVRAPAASVVTFKASPFIINMVNLTHRSKLTFLETLPRNTHPKS